MATKNLTILTRAALDAALSADTVQARGGIVLSVPSYAWPGSSLSADPSPWRRAGAAGARVVTLNPASGPGTSTNAAFTRVIDEAHSRGVVTLGYVNGASSRTLAQITADVDAWMLYYPGIDGIFLGGSDPAHTGTLYADARAYVRGKRADLLVCLAPGTDMTAEGLYDACDIALTFVGTAAAYLAKTFVPDRSRVSSKQWHVVTAATADQLAQIVGKARDLGAHHLFVTDAADLTILPGDVFLDAAAGRATGGGAAAPDGTDLAALIS